MTPIDADNILRHELIGLEVDVIEDSNPSNESISGRVVDESRNTLLIQQEGNAKRVAKRTAVFRFRLPDGTRVEVEGSAIVGRPEDRVKKKIRRGW